jgi:hypothetical protein
MCGVRKTEKMADLLFQQPLLEVGTIFNAELR